MPLSEASTTAFEPQRKLSRDMTTLQAAILNSQIGSGFKLVCEDPEQELKFDDLPPIDNSEVRKSEKVHKKEEKSRPSVSAMIDGKRMTWR